VAGGVVIAALNDAMLMVPRTTLLPGGHHEAYLLTGFAVATLGSNLLGLFDRGITMFR
jgi:hypothetical protein